MHLFPAAAAAYRKNRCSHRFRFGRYRVHSTCTPIPRRPLTDGTHCFRVSTTILYLAVVYYNIHTAVMMINNDFYRPWKIAAVVFRNSRLRDLAGGGRENFFSIYVFDNTRAHLNAYPRPENLFQHGRRGDDDGADDVMLIFVCTRQSGRRQNFFFKNMLTRTRSVCFHFYLIKSRRDRYSRADPPRINDVRYTPRASFSDFGVASCRYRHRNDHVYST